MKEHVREYADQGLTHGELCVSVGSSFYRAGWHAVSVMRGTKWYGESGHGEV